MSSTAAPAQERTIPREILTLAGAFGLIFMGTGAQQQFLAPFFRETYEWTALQRGLVPGAVYLSMTIWRVPIVWVVHRIGERPAMLIGGATYVLFPLAVYFIPTWWMLVACAATWGIGATLMWVTSSIRVLDASARHHFGKSAGVFSSGTFLGLFIGTLGLSFVASTWSLRTVFLVSSIVTSLGWFLMMTLPKVETMRSKPDLRTVLSFTKSSSWRVVAALLFLSALGYGLMLVPLGEWIIVGLGVSSLALSAGHPLARLVVALTAGWLSDRIGRRSVIVGGFLLAAAGLGLTALVPASPFALLAGILSLGLMNGLAPTVGLAFVGDMGKRETRLMLHSSLFANGDIGVATAMLSGQALQVGLGGFAQTFGVFAVVLAACGIWAFFSFRERKVPASAA